MVKMKRGVLSCSLERVYLRRKGGRLREREGGMFDLDGFLVEDKTKAHGERGERAVCVYF